MSKFDEFDMDELEQLTEEALGEQIADEEALAPRVEQGPTPAIAATSGSNKEVVQHYSHCNLCGGRLHFNYLTDFSRNTTHEKASCPECGLDSRQVLHRLQ